MKLADTLWMISYKNKDRIIEEYDQIVDELYLRAKHGELSAFINTPKDKIIQKLEEDGFQVFQTFNSDAGISLVTWSKTKIY